MNKNHKFPYKWYLKDGYPAKGIEPNGLKVFSTFACGGGSTMGYKLAGFDVIGANDIDPKMAEVYKHNHNPKHYFLCPIGELLNKELPKELYDLDILDGSPPCSTFSMSGDREKAFKKKKKFNEGQAEQVLSDLFFDFIDLCEKLKPKVIIAENVKGMLIGNAKAYTKQVMNRFKEIGYSCQLFCLNSASMGVPQRRQRVFFVASKQELKKNKIDLVFKENPILYREFKSAELGPKLTGKALEIYKARKKTDSSLCDTLKRIDGNQNKYFTSMFIKDNEVCPTVIASESSPIIRMDFPNKLNKEELLKIGSYPIDYQFLENKPKYLVGMSVPPVMTAQIAHQVYLQWFKEN